MAQQGRDARRRSREIGALWSFAAIVVVATPMLASTSRGQRPPPPPHRVVSDSEQAAAILAALKGLERPPPPDRPESLTRRDPVQLPISLYESNVSGAVLERVVRGARLAVVRGPLGPAACVIGVDTASRSAWYREFAPNYFDPRRPCHLPAPGSYVTVQRVESQEGHPNDVEVYIDLLIERADDMARLDRVVVILTRRGGEWIPTWIGPYVRS